MLSKSITIFLCSIFNNDVSSSKYRMLHDRMINEWCICNNMKACDHGIMFGSIPASARVNSAKAFSLLWHAKEFHIPVWPVQNFLLCLTTALTHPALWVLVRVKLLCKTVVCFPDSSLFILHSTTQAQHLIRIVYRHSWGLLLHFLLPGIKNIFQQFYLQQKTPKKSFHLSCCVTVTHIISKWAVTDV